MTTRTTLTLLALLASCAAPPRHQPALGPLRLQVIGGVHAHDARAGFIAPAPDSDARLLLVVRRVSALRYWGQPEPGSLSELLCRSTSWNPRRLPPDRIACELALHTLEPQRAPTRRVRGWAHVPVADTWDATREQSERTAAALVRRLARRLARGEREPADPPYGPPTPLETDDDDPLTQAVLAALPPGAEGRPAHLRLETLAGDAGGLRWISAVADLSHEDWHQRHELQLWLPPTADDREIPERLARLLDPRTLLPADRP